MDSRSYTDFEPRSQWVHEEETDTLIVDVSGFNKEQMKVLIDTSGNLKISGERQINGNQWTRFLTYFKVSKNCNPKGIQAKFDKDEGLLYVVLPKSLTQKATGSSTQGQLTQSQQEETFLSSQTTSNGAYGSQPMLQNRKGEKIGSEGMSNVATALKKNKLFFVGVLIAIVVVAGIGTYVGLKSREV